VDSTGFGTLKPHNSKINESHWMTIDQTKRHQQSGLKQRTVGPTLGYRPPEILNNECIIENQQHCFLLVISTE